MPVTVFPIRHHGPGSARSLRAALEALEPDAVLVEGPPDADGVIDLAADAGMRPPVALLVHVRDEPHRAAFWPLAVFSPEWQAITYALETKATVHFIDLPAAIGFALEEQERREGRDGKEPRPAPSERPEPAPRPEPQDPVGEQETQPEAAPERPAVHVRQDPLTWLATAAGYGDAETWWEDMVEQRPGGPGPLGQGPFDAITEAIAALRAEAPEPPRRELLREATMRQHIRAAVRAGHERVAVVCGAWHAPALTDLPPATADRALLTGLPKAKVTATWVPWTHDRLAQASGYGAGVTSPGWYHHLFTEPADPVIRWLTRTARLLRDEGLAAPSASVVEATRLADALAGLRGRPLAGLDELLDATRAALTAGSDVPLALVHQRLIVGEEIGGVPEHTPMVPLAADLARQQKRLKLKPAALSKELRLDLRREIDRDRSALLYRLDLLGVRWGRPRHAAGATGTFREHWELAWRPELSVQVIEASRWGTTVATAAAARARDLIGEAGAGGDALGDLGRLTERCLLADLAEAVGPVMRALGDRAAEEHDAAHLLAAIPPLARVLRYGDVRQTDTAAVGEIVEDLVVRACIALPMACASLDEGAARDMLAQVMAVHGALAMLDRADWRARWQQALADLTGMQGLHGLLAGRATRLLLDAGAVTGDEAARRLGLALSPAEEPDRAAAWIEGFLAGSGLLLLHDEQLLRLLDRWLVGVPDTAFTALMPLLRRTSSTFDAPERRQLGERAAALDRAAAAGQTDAASGGAAAVHADSGGLPNEVDGLHAERAAAALRTVALLLGLDDQATGGAHP